MKCCFLIILTTIFYSCSENEYKGGDKFCDEKVCVHFDSNYEEFSSIKIAIEEREKVFENLGEQGGVSTSALAFDGTQIVNNLESAGLEFTIKLV